MNNLELHERKDFVTQNLELDFVLESRLRQVPNMNKDELIDLINILSSTLRQSMSVTYTLQELLQSEIDFLNTIVKQ